MVDPSALSPFLAACRGDQPSRAPVWFQRQAGRSLPEYRAARGTGSILDAIAQPEIAAEVTLQPVRRYGVDAAVLFSDIVVPVAGAPFTVASYLVEGGPSRTFSKVKALMHAEPALWEQLVDRLADMAIAFTSAQVAAGAQAVQLFDSWAGSLSPMEYERFALPATRKVMDALGDLGVPRILFGVGTGELLRLMATSGADVIGIDWRVPLDVAAGRVGGLPVQGNLDPAIVLAGTDIALEAARDVLRRGAAAPGHIFNLGHGVLPETDPDVLEAIVTMVHDEGLSLRSEGMPQ